MVEEEHLAGRFVVRHGLRRGNEPVEHRGRLHLRDAGDLDDRIGELVELGEIPDCALRGVARALERVNETVAEADEVLDLRLHLVAPPRRVGHRLLAEAPRLRHHVATLLLGQLQLGLHLAVEVGALTDGVEHRLLADAPCLVLGVAQRPIRFLGGVGPDLLRRLARDGEHPRGLLADERGDRLLVQRTGIGQTQRLLGLQLALEEPDPVVHPGELGRHHAEEVADLLLVVPAAHDAELGRPDRRR